MTLAELVKQVWPEFPDDRKVVGTPDKHAWYKINMLQRTLFVPTVFLLRQMVHEIDAFTEAVKAFAVSDLSGEDYSWDNLVLHTAQSTEEARDFLVQIGQARYIACDIETKRIELDDNKVLAIGFCTDRDTAYAIPYKYIPYDELQALFNRIDLCFIWHNGKFDVSRLKYLMNIDARVDEDTMLLHYVRVNVKRGTNGLKYLAQLYLQAPAWEDELLEIRKTWCSMHKVRLDEFTYDMFSNDVLLPYMMKDVIATYRLFFKLLEVARPESEWIYRKLIEASEAYKHVELNGLYIDMDYLEQLEFELDNELAAAEKVLDEVVKKYWNPLKYAMETGAKTLPANFNVKSPKQLKWMLETTLGVRLPSTNAETIAALLDEDDQHFQNTEVLKSIQVVRQLSKYMDTYIQGIRTRVSPDMRLRGTFNLHGTETGRLSSSEPNLQNIPRNKRIKKLIAAEPGNVLMQLDYSQAELRVLAALSGDEFMCQIYKDGRDLHAEIATKLFGESFSVEERNMAKGINFGIIYGRGPGSIAKVFKLSMDEAKKLIKDWFKSLPQVEAFIQEQRKKPLKNIECTTIFGRQRTFVITEDQMHHIQNEYSNTPIQSVASDLTLFSLIEMHYAFMDLPVKIIASVHDSIILELPNDPMLIEQVAEIAQNIMQTVPQTFIPNCQVPFVADVQIGGSWGDMNDLEAASYSGEEVAS